MNVHDANIADAMGRGVPEEVARAQLPGNDTILTEKGGVSPQLVKSGGSSGVGQYANDLKPLEETQP